MKPFTRKILTVFATVATCLPFAANAESWHGHEDHHDQGRRDYDHHGYYHGHDYGQWRTGSWRHGWHNHVSGWWWVAGGNWYFYNRPVYPYPEVFFQEAPVPAPPAQPPVITQGPPPPTGNWYYCENPRGYYPYVANCQSGWRSVPATPQR